MSATRTLQQQDDEPEYPCEYGGCDDTRTREDSVEGSYCSQNCADADRGETFLKRLAQDHRFCSGCYRPRKTVFRPPDRESPKLRTKGLVIREAFVGFEELTEHATEGAYGIECRCSAVNHDIDDPDLREGSPYEWWLKRAADQLRSEGQDFGPLSIATFADALWDGVDFAVAVGRALR